MNGKWWLGWVLIAAGVSVLLLAPTLKADVTIGFPVDRGPPTVGPIDVQVTLLGYLIMVGAVFSVVIGGLLVWVVHRGKPLGGRG